MLTPGARVHIIGVGGAGMSAVARVLLGMGCTVSGSDARESDVTRALRDEGVDVHIGHDASFVHGRDVVLWSPAIPADHVERRAAIDEGARCLSRAELLEELSGVFAVLGLTGTHGKTTATSMMAHVLASAGEDVGRMLGADVRGLGPNGVAGTSGRLVMEVDESYGTFATITPQALGLLNVEADHLDHYGSLEALEAAFAALVERTAGPVVVFTDDPGAARVAAMGVRSVVGVGRHEGDWRISAENLTRDGASFTLVGDATSFAVTLQVTGAHNVANAAVVAVLALECGIDVTAITDGLAAFRGAPRRFERHGTWRGADVIADYAHLPGEIAATIRSARDSGYEHIVAIFQPHRVTRTLNVGAGFGPAFVGVEHVLVTDIYASGEANPTNLTGEYVVEVLRTHGLLVHYTPSFADVISALRDVSCDLLLVLGAGDIPDVIAQLPLDPISLARATTYRVGGSLARWIECNADDDLSRLPRAAQDLVVVGNGSNLLVADGVHDRTGVHLGGDFAQLHWHDDGDAVMVRAGAGLDLPIAARRLVAEGIRGFEWAVGVPGTFGGAVAMNAGGHGSDMAAAVTAARVWRRGEIGELDAADLSFGYRTSAIGPSDIVLDVTLRLHRGDVEEGKAMLRDIVAWRRAHQPGGANAGSVFRNPEGDSAGRLIEAAGCKGLRMGTARVSEKHANFIIADEGGSANDIYALMQYVRDAVAAHSGVTLRYETRCIGFEEK